MPIPNQIQHRQNYYARLEGKKPSKPARIKYKPASLKSQVADRPSLATLLGLKITGTPKPVQSKPEKIEKPVKLRLPVTQELPVPMQALPVPTQKQPELPPIQEHAPVPKPNKRLI